LSPELPEDPLLHALAEYWDDVLRLAEDQQRERLRGLITGTIEPDPVDARVAIADELLELLPPTHPLVDVLRTGTMFDPGARSIGAIEKSLARLRARALGTHAATVDAPELDDFDRQVQARLLELPYASPAALRTGGVDPNDERLIRLKHPSGEVRLPSFQFTGSGEPWQVVLRVNEQLGAATDPWGVTCWWVDPHAWLDAVPAGLLGGGHDGVLLQAAAGVGVD
jgi:hypothetical protein